jgi:putative pyruvate formate lyase activating enzyme
MLMEYSSFLSPLEELRDCSCCPRNCHADRFSSKTGYCKSGTSFNISSICIHRGEEPAISGVDGICNVFFTNCNLQCVYCQNWQISKNRKERKSTEMSLENIIREITSILDGGINMIGFVSPSHVIPQMKIIIDVLESIGYQPVKVYNSNGYDKPETIKSLEGIIDVYLPDFKYMDPEISSDYSDTADYPEVASLSLKEMYRQKGSVLHLADNGTAESGIIIRHLILPGHIENSRKVLRFIAEEISPRLHISLMSQYYPTPGVFCHPMLKRPLKQEEYETVVIEMNKLGFSYGWIQELDSRHDYRPDFKRKHPFEN